MSIVQEEGVKRILCEVPVEVDGSVHFKAPAGVTLYFQLLDAQRRCLHTIRSFTGLMPASSAAVSAVTNPTVRLHRRWRAWHSGARQQSFVGRPKDIERVVAKIARIPSQSVTTSDRDRLLSLDRDLKLVIYGQDQAIADLVSAIKLSRSGLGDPEKPVGSFCFSGRPV